jgi:hypothetical protein
LLREAIQAMAAEKASTEQRAARDALRQLPTDAILAFAPVLSGPATQQYRASSSSSKLGSSTCSMWTAAT